MLKYRHVLLAVFLGLLTAGRASAHALGAECKIRGDRVQVEAYFDDDTPAGDAKVSVVGPDKSTVAEGRTDADGRWSFPTPPPGKYEVVVNAGAGHRASVRLTIGTVATQPAASEGPSREEFTQIHWLQIGIGLGAIAAFTGAWLLSRRLSRKN